MNKFTSLILNLLPKGLAWNKDAGSRLSKFSEGMAEEYFRIEQRGNDLLVEFNPTQTTELLPDWEKLLDLPDPAFGEPETNQERRSLVTFKFSLKGGQSKQYYIDLVKKLGFTIEIEEFLPFRAGESGAGDALNQSDDWRHTFLVRMNEAAAYYFSAGQSSAGDPLVSFRNDVVQGIIRKFKPAHTHVIFSFNGEE